MLCSEHSPIISVTDWPLYCARLQTSRAYLETVGIYQFSTLDTTGSQLVTVTGCQVDRHVRVQCPLGKSPSIITPHRKRQPRLLCLTVGGTLLVTARREQDVPDSSGGWCEFGVVSSLPSSDSACLRLLRDPQAHLKQVRSCR